MLPDWLKPSNSRPASIPGALHYRRLTKPIARLKATRLPARSWSIFQAKPRRRSTVAKRIGVAVDRRSAAKIGVVDLRSLREIALLHVVDHALHVFTFIHGIADHVFYARAQ